MTGRIFLKLIVGVLVVLVVALTAVDFLSSTVARNAYVGVLETELVERARMLAAWHDREGKVLDAVTLAPLAQAMQARVSVVSSGGKLIADVPANNSAEDLASTPEVRAALSGATGHNVARVGGSGHRLLSVAVPVQGGALRLAVPLEIIEEQVSAVRVQLLASVALAFIPVVLVAGFFARYVSSKLGRIIDYAGTLAEGNFSARLADPGADELGVLSHKLNETGQKLEKMFEELEREHAELEKLERVRKDFVINVSHELRTPLASIQGYAETLLEGAIHDQDNNVRFVTIIRQNAERLARLTADLLVLSRLELKTQKFNFASYYVNLLLQECVDSIVPMAQKKLVSLHLIPAPEGTEVACDAEAMHQIVNNLLDNALKYTPESGKITVRATTIADGSMVRIAVTDTGVGIPDEDLPRLFERFYRVDKARSRALGGTGLGLAIVKHLVRAHGGDVQVESQMNQGSTFSFTMPVEHEGFEVEDVQSELTQM